QQGIVRHEEEWAAIIMFRTVVASKLITHNPCDSLGAQIEHGFVMRLQRLAETRKVGHDDACCHGTTLHPCAQSEMSAEWHCQERVVVQRADASIWAAAIALMLQRFV